jgi:magnesium-transporting ATPase (P-type)
MKQFRIDNSVPYGVMITKEEIDRRSDAIFEEMETYDGDMSATIAGSQLVNAMQTERIIKVLKKCKAVVVYRCSPAQKAGIV